MDKIKDFDESKVNEDLRTARSLLETPPACTNPRLEEVARIFIESAEEARQHRGGGGDAAAIPSAACTVAWDRYKHARSALNVWWDRSSRNESYVRDLRAIRTSYLASKYQYHLQARIEPPEVGPSSYVPTEKDEIIESTLWDLDSHLLLGRCEWSRLYTSLQKDLDSLNKWERGDGSHPKSKAPSTPYLTRLWEILNLFEEEDHGIMMLAIRYAAENESHLNEKMCDRHVDLVCEMRAKVALGEVDKDIASIAVWVPKVCDTTLLEMAMRSHKFDIMKFAAKIK